MQPDEDGVEINLLSSNQKVEKGQSLNSFNGEGDVYIFTDGESIKCCVLCVGWSEEARALIDVKPKLCRH